MALPCGTTGSLRPTFVPARPVSLAVKHPYAFTPVTYQRSSLLRPLKEISSCGGFRTYMLSVLIPSRRSYSAVLLAEQQIHQRSVQLGPLVLESNPLKFLTTTTDRDRTVSRRSEPSSRATLMLSLIHI